MSLGGGGGSSPPATAQADTAEGRALYQEQAELAREQAGLSREQAALLRESRPLIDEQTGLIREQAGIAREQAALLRDSRPLIDEQVGLLREQAETSRELRGMAREQWDIYKEHGLGALRNLGEKVENYASPTRIAQQEGLAATDVKSAYANQRQGFFRNMSRYGVKPGSGRFASSLRALALGEAGDTAGAKTRTRTGILERDLANRFGLAAAWQGRDSSAMAGLGNSASLLGNAGMGLGVGAQRLAAGLGGAASSLGNAAGNLGSGYFNMAGGLGNAANTLGNAGMNIGNAAGGFSNMGIQSSRDHATMQGGLYSGIGSLVGSLGSAWLLSDERLKQDIKAVAQLDSGIHVFEFSYLDDPENRYTGVIAQEVVDIKPYLVGESDGYLMVNYDLLMKEEIVSEMAEAA